MSNQIDISLSTYQGIADAVQRTPGNYSTLATIASMVNNQEFKQGYVDLYNYSFTPKSYIWKALSAVSEQLGESLFKNVRDYIDNVSNVDVCKVHALKSMLKQLDIEYLMLDKVQYYPIEIQNLIDIMSITKEHLFNNRFMKNDFLKSLQDDGIISAYGVIDDENFGEVSCFLEQSSFYDDYLSSVYYNFINDMLHMPYIDNQYVLSSSYKLSTEIYTTLKLSDGYGKGSFIEDRYLKQKKFDNIDVQFDVVQTVNDIEAGLLELTSFTGAKRALLEEEIKYRSSSLSCSYPNLPLSAYSLVKYSYYRKQKVIEYARFVDNMNVPEDIFMNQIIYRYDPEYFELSGYRNQNYCIQDIGVKPKIIENDVCHAAIVLAQITKYIAKLRQTIKLQTRKVYMKGTNNLLKYTVNEFLIDYIEYMKHNLPASAVSSIVQKLSAHSINDVEVVEYWDQTEYMNISAATTKYAQNRELVNPRYFDQAFYRENGKLIPYDNGAFTTDEINQFYLSTLGLKNTLYQDINNKNGQELSSNFYEFLSVLFDVAANNSYYNSAGHFGAKLSNTTITEDIDSHLALAQNICVDISSLAMRAGFTFDDRISVGQQLEDFKNAVYSLLSNRFLSQVSSVYNDVSPQVVQISVDLQQQIQNLSTYLNVTKAHYFKKSTNIYSYDVDGEYLFDYFVDNPNMMTDGSYINQLTLSREWIFNDHCHTYPVLCAISQLSVKYDDSYDSIQSLVEQLTSINFTDPEIKDLDAEMNSIRDFLQQKSSDRLAFLQNALANFRSQASQLKTTYDGLASQLNTLLAQLPDTSQGWYIQSVKSGGNLKKTDDKTALYDSFSQSYYKTDTKDGDFISVDFDSQYDIQATDNFNNKIGRGIGRLQECSNIFYGYIAQYGGSHMNHYRGSSSAGTPRSSGVTEEALNSLKNDYNNLNVQLNSICQQVSELYNIPMTGEILTPATDNNGTPVEQRIQNLISILGTKISESQFESDAILHRYNENLTELNRISTDYVPARDEYEVLWNVFSEFFADFPKANDYKLFIPSNIERVNDYTLKVDSTAQNEISAWFSDAISQYESLENQTEDLCKQNIMLYLTPSQQFKYEFNSGMPLEDTLSDLMSKLSDDIVNRTIIGQKQLEDSVAYIDDEINVIASPINPKGLYREYFPNALGRYTTPDAYKRSFNAQYKSFIEIVNQIVMKLNYVNDEEYLQSNTMFQTYSGVPQIATDPYYNLKNQTHPSYQIHPLLWNFSEVGIVNQSLMMISRTLANINYEELEGDAIAGVIDNYIGKFGNLIDVWCTHINDFTGYKTRYEASTHICKYTGISSEVVDYDGAFYPPALERYLTSSDHTLSSISSYYQHLQFFDNDISTFVNDALISSYNEIAHITRLYDEGYEPDIFKYAIDAYGNAYILYKEYDSANMSQYDKLHTPGDLWIRPADTPIAFPLRRIVDVSYYYPLENMQICDFEFLGTGTKLVLTYKTEQDLLKSIPLFVKYDIVKDTGFGTIALTDIDILDGDDGTEYQTAEFPAKDMPYDYVGCYPMSKSAVNVVYIQKDFTYDISTDKYALSSIPDNPNLIVYQIDNDTLYANPIKFEVDVENVECDNPAVSQYADKDGNMFVDVAFVVSCENEGKTFTAYKQLSVSNILDANGYSSTDPTTNDMNSFDQFSQDIVVKRLSLKKNALKLANTMHFQQNTDMGYSPSYTYNDCQNVLSIADEINYSHQAIELLGKSKDIDSLIDSTVTEIDPYLSKKDICDRHLYGRVYEDDAHGKQFSIEDDTTLTLFSNKSMYRNMPSQFYGTERYGYYHGSYIWDILLNNYSFDQLFKYKLFIYSTETLGRNPYVVADLSDVIRDSLSLSSGQFLSTSYDNTQGYETTGYEISDSMQRIVVGGTQNGMNQIDMNVSNKIFNISHLNYKFVVQNVDKYIQLAFRIENLLAEGYIKQDTIKVALVDNYDIKFFEWFHYLAPGITFDQCMKELKSIHNNSELSAALDSIDLSEFSNLSDVSIDDIRILQTNRRLQFKIDDDDMYDPNDSRYFVPTINTKMPLTIGQYFTQTMINASDIDSIVHVFDKDEVYVLDVQDPAVLSTVGEIGMQSEAFDVIDEYRVYEDYYHVDDNDVLNSNKYPTDDPQFFQYVHFSQISAPCYLEPSTSVINDIRVDNIVDGLSDPFSQYINKNNWFGMHSEESFDSSYIPTSIDYDEFSSDEQQQFIERMKPFLRIYMNYKKSSEGITLYANYQNYINSPFIKLSQGRTYIDTIEGTYAKIDPGQKSYLNLMLQFRKYAGDSIIGIKNAVIATYQICNVSDDKPKFIIRKMSEAHHSQFEYHEEPYIVIQSQKMDIQLDAQSQSTEIEYYMQLKSNVDLSSAVKCTISYPSTNLSAIEDDNVKSFANGIAQFEFTDLYRVVKIKFKVLSNSSSTSIIKIIKHPEEQNGIAIISYDGIIICRA